MILFLTLHLRLQWALNYEMGWIYIILFFFSNIFIEESDEQKRERKIKEENKEFRRDFQRITAFRIRDKL